MAAVARFVVRWCRPVAVLGLTSYGAWLIYRPAGYLCAGALVLLDLVTDKPRS